MTLNGLIALIFRYFYQTLEWKVTNYANCMAKPWVSVAKIQTTVEKLHY